MTDIIAPSFRTWVKPPTRLQLVLMESRAVHPVIWYEARRCSWVVQMNVAKKVVRVGLGVPFLEFLPHLAVGGTNIVGHHISQNVVCIKHFRQFYGGVVVQ
jgi:hypothetical protein